MVRYKNNLEKQRGKEKSMCVQHVMFAAETEYGMFERPQGDQLDWNRKHGLGNIEYSCLNGY